MAEQPKFKSMGGFYQADVTLFIQLTLLHNLKNAATLPVSSSRRSSTGPQSHQYHGAPAAPPVAPVTPSTGFYQPATPPAHAAPSYFAPPPMQPDPMAMGGGGVGGYGQPMQPSPMQPPPTFDRTGTPTNIFNPATAVPDPVAPPPTSGGPPPLGMLCVFEVEIVYY